MTSATPSPSPSARYLLLASTLFLSVGGLLMIYSASFAKDFLDYGDSFNHVKHQAIFLALGFESPLNEHAEEFYILPGMGGWVPGGLFVLLMIEAVLRTRGAHRRAESFASKGT